MQTRTPAAVAIAIAGAAHAQYIDDGDMDDLEVGTNPDCDVPAGAWWWPREYTSKEFLPEQYTIVPTSEFIPGAEGNSLALKYDGPGMRHLPNILSQTILEGDGIVIFSFRLWVRPDFYGGAVYIGGDHLGDNVPGFGQVDRGPQLRWRGDGMLTIWDCDLNTGHVVTEYAPETWQNVIIHADLETDTFDLYWSEGDDEPVLMESDWCFYKANNLDHIDRVTYSALGVDGPIRSYLDDVDVQVVQSCPADYNADGDLNILDFVAFQAGWLAQDPAADCDANGDFNILDFVCFQQLFQAGCD